MKLHQIEKTKNGVARKFFSKLNEKITEERVKYGVVTDYAKLMGLANEMAAWISLKQLFYYMSRIFRQTKHEARVTILVTAGTLA